jgi:AcrR family transcriptional regulator
MSHPAAPTWPPDIGPLSSPVTDEIWERFRQATIDVALERGYYAFEVSDIVERAEASRAEFDARFDGKVDCCDRTYEANIAEFDQALVVPYLHAPSWREGLRAGALGAAEYLRAHTREREYGALRKSIGGPMVQAARDLYLQRVVDLIDVGRCELDDPDALGRGTAEGVLGSINGLLINRLKESEGIDLEIIDELMYIVVRPYAGHDAGLRELSTPQSQVVRPRNASSGQPARI